MPDADDFDVDSLRALLRGAAPKPEAAHDSPTAAPAAATKKPGTAARVNVAAAGKSGASGAKTKPAAPVRRRGRQR